MTKKLTLRERFLKRVDIGNPNECWPWKGWVNDKGYGICPDGKRGVGIPAHRVSYTLFVGPIPFGTEIDHVKNRGCTMKHCVNFNHLEAVTHQENVLRGNSPAALHALIETCPKGHPYDEKNTYMRPDRKGRECRACRHERRTRMVSEKEEGVE